MKKTTSFAIISLIIIINLILIYLNAKMKKSLPIVEDFPVLTHQQQIWRGALEWCESRGKNTAINAVDRDGTPSYYAFQFKPNTLRYYGERYGLIAKGKSDAEIMELLAHYEIQSAIVDKMILDPTTVWEKQFSECVRKLGRPPKNL